MPERLIYVVRHGVAEERSSSGRDADRALTPEGRKKTKRAARGLASLAVCPARVLTSPLCRARETAEIVAECLGVAVERCAQLAPPVDECALSGFLDQDQPGRDVMLVGHEPDLGELIAYWLTGRRQGVAVHVRKGSVACLAAGMLPPQGRATLEWMMSAGQLGRLREEGD